MRFLWIGLVLLALTGCGGGDATPVKSGSDLDELRRSPCACGDDIAPRPQWRNEPAHV